MSPNDGGPAFPSEQGTIPEGSWNQTWDPGMSLRDYFAAAALTGICACLRDYEGGDRADGRVRVAYKHADAMLAQRAKGVGDG